MPANGKSLSTSELRKLAGAAARAAKSKKIKSFALVLPSLVEAPAAAQAAAEGIITGDFDVDTYRSDRKDQQLTEATLSSAPTADADAVGQGHRRGRHPRRIAEPHPRPRP